MALVSFANPLTPNFPANLSVNLAQVNGDTVAHDGSNNLSVNLAALKGASITGSNALPIDVEQVLGSTVSTSNAVPVTSNTIQKVDIEQVLGTAISTSNPVPVNVATIGPITITGPVEVINEPGTILLVKNKRNVFLADN